VPSTCARASDRVFEYLLRAEAGGSAERGTSHKGKEDEGVSCASRVGRRSRSRRRRSRVAKTQSRTKANPQVAQSQANRLNLQLNSKRYTIF
jgi:hypothetical protein